MKLTNLILSQLFEGINQFYARNGLLVGNIYLEVKAYYALRKNKPKVLEALTPYFEARDLLLDKCNAERKAISGNAIHYNIPPEYQEQFAKEMNELNDIEVEIEIHKCDVEEFHPTQNKLSPALLEMIEPMLIFEE